MHGTVGETGQYYTYHCTVHRESVSTRWVQTVVGNTVSSGALVAGVVPNSKSGDFLIDTGNGRSEGSSANSEIQRAKSSGEARIPVVFSPRWGFSGVGCESPAIAPEASTNDPPSRLSP